ncbi:hypothetical protein DdX_14208 [Ditylenchus destructor]|uniref:Uncharacterized protein n=1 Tax=Ditylenchus destructor TaxID=166010 RepID=A0AAD4MUK9_9BILA|nr:hypothetical protein DdX_14208 [Ditylenchus destructor]
MSEKADSPKQNGSIKRKAARATTKMDQRLQKRSNAAMPNATDENVPIITDNQPENSNVNSDVDKEGSNASLGVSGGPAMINVDGRNGRTETGTTSDGYIPLDLKNPKHDSIWWLLRYGNFKERHHQKNGKF